MTNVYSNDYRHIFLKSPPCPVYWAGWESDTHKLQQFGWDLSIDHSPESRTMNIGIRHEKCGVYGFGSMIEKRFAEEHRYMNVRIAFKMEHVARDVCFETICPPSFNFVPIDATPEWTQINFQRHRMSEMDIFKKVNPDIKSIILNEVSLNEIMDLALQKQEPIQEKIRKRMLKDQEYKQAFGTDTAMLQLAI